MLPNRGILHSARSFGLARSVWSSWAGLLPGYRDQLPSASPNWWLQQTARSNLRKFATSRHDTHALGRRLKTSQPTAGFASGYAFLARHASTEASSAASAVSDAASPDLLSGITQTLDPTLTELLNTPETVGFLHRMGLDYGWGPTSMMQWLLEHVYVMTGLPWWASIAAVALMARAALFKLTLDSQEMSQRLTDLRRFNPRYDKAQAAMKAAWSAQDKMGMMAARQESVLLEKQEGIRKYKLLGPLYQLPIVVGMFRCLKGMANLPVPSLETDGLLWITDLTVSDSLFVLPILTAALSVISIRNSIPYMAPQQQRVTRYMFIAIGPVSFLFTVFQPAAVQLWFVFSALTQWAQATVFYNPRCRIMLGLVPLTKAAPTNSARKVTYAPPRSPPATVDATTRPAAPVEEEGPNFFHDIKHSVHDARASLRDKAAQGAEKKEASAREKLVAKRELMEEEARQQRIREQLERRRQRKAGP